jgi:lipoprotein-anchoring transpeptidase ErfK/SrfK
MEKLTNNLIQGGATSRLAFSRRDFLKTSLLGLSGMALPGWLNDAVPAVNRVLPLAEFPAGERLGRVLGGKVEVKAKPDDAAPTVKELFEDSVVVWNRELVGSRPLWITQRYVETPDGFIYAPNLQVVRNQLNTPVTAIPAEGGMWVEVTVPYVDIVLANPPGRSPWLEHTATPRLYYSQILWVDQIKTNDQGQVVYRISDRYGGFGDFFWAAGEAFRPLTPDELAPINPEAVDKLVKVNLESQTVSCMEGNQEVYFCRVSTGPKITSTENPQGKWATPPGQHTIWRKLISVHMTGGTTGGGYDLPGIGWTTLFASKGMAIHSTFWHNNYGFPQSHGCVNCTPDDAKWIFRWSLPGVSIEPGDITISGQGSTKVLVSET